jgi:hypothetical protein
MRGIIAIISAACALAGIITTAVVVRRKKQQAAAGGHVSKKTKAKSKVKDKAGPAKATA